MLRLLFFCCILVSSSCSESFEFESLSDPVSVFSADQDGYLCYRIPAIVKAANGDLIAFAEARKDGCSDTGNIDLVMKRSPNQGKTWGSLHVIWDDSLNTAGNPSPIMDESTGNIILLSTWNLGEDHERDIIAGTSIDTRRVFVLVSEDHGSSWSEPKEITESVKKPDWTWYATGPGSGIQLKQGDKKGRLLIACDHIEAETKHYYSHSIYSDDGGSTWNLGASSPTHQVNECEVAELSDGSLMLNMRNYDRANKARQVAYSYDQGITWKNQTFDSSLIEPICQASLVSSGPMLFFSNPHSNDKRENMTIQVSLDNGRSWTTKKQLSNNPAAYSDLVVVQAPILGILYETGIASPYEDIVFQAISHSYRKISFVPRETF